MTGESQPAAPPAETPPPDPSGEDAQWVALAKELEQEESGQDANAAVDALHEQRKHKPGPDAPRPEPDPKPKPTYEELETHSRRTAAALREARDRERQSNERLTGITQLIERLRAGRQEPAKEEPRQPTVEEDPIGYFQGELAKRDQVIQQLQQGTRQTAEQMQAQQHEHAFWGAVERSEQEIRKTTSDYDDACKHLEAGRVAELEVMLPDDSPQAQAYAAQYKATPAQLRAHMLNQDRIAVAQQALQLGTSPAQLYYSLAKQRGYTPAPNGKDNGAEKIIETVRRGQAAARSISGGGGKLDKTASLTDLIDLYSEDPEAFDREWDKAAREGRLG